MAERFKAAVLKTARGFTLPRGFESHPFRQNRVRYRSPPVAKPNNYAIFSQFPSVRIRYLFATIPQIVMDDFVGEGGRFMTRKLNRLTARTVATATKPGLHADGGGLYLRVGRGGAKSWCLRYMLEGKAREMGLGGLSKVSLADARKRAAEHRLLLVDKVDPIERREGENTAKKIAAARSVTFDECATAYVDAHKAGWRNAKHRQQWTNTLATYVSPKLGSVSVADVDVAMIMRVIEPLWTIKPETAARVRGRIEAVLDWAKARDFRDGENPARWRGHLSNLLPARAKVRAVKHHAALPYGEISAFMADLRTREGVAAAALEFLILTAARTGEVIGARWPEIELAWISTERN